MTARLRFRWLQRGFLILGLLLLALWSRNWFESRRFQAAESKKFAAALRVAASGPLGTATSTATVVDPPVPAPPTHATEQQGVLGTIEIPRLRIAAVVAEGSDARTLRHAVGHIPSTALPGHPGNCALAGHRDTFLRGLGGVRVDDVIRIVTLERTCTYRVVWSVVVEPQRVDVLDSTATPSLTLVTCYPFAFVGHAPQRFVVRATQVETIAGSPVITDRGAHQPQGLTAERR
jgi:sortase A